MFFINQRDYPDTPYPTVTDHPEYEAGKHTTVATSACGICASMMALDRLFVTGTYSFTLEEGLALSYAVHANNGHGTNGLRYFPALAEKFHLRYVATDDMEEMKACLRTGGVAIALVGENLKEGYIGVFTHQEHYVTVISVNAENRFSILDPYQYDGKYDEPGRAGKVRYEGKIAVCDESVLADDVRVIVNKSLNPDIPHTLAFHLFWRS